MIIVKRSWRADWSASYETNTLRIFPAFLGNAFECTTLRCCSMEPIPTLLTQFNTVDTVKRITLLLDTSKRSWSFYMNYQLFKITTLNGNYHDWNFPSFWLRLELLYWVSIAFPLTFWIHLQTCQMAPISCNLMRKYLIFVWRIAPVFHLSQISC